VSFSAWEGGQTANVVWAGTFANIKKVFWYGANARDSTPIDFPARALGLIFIVVEPLPAFSYFFLSSVLVNIKRITGIRLSAKIKIPAPLKNLDFHESRGITLIIDTF
jgi:hypothetical protein